MEIALESTVFTHGFDYPHNIEIAMRLEQVARDNGCQPRTIGIINGEPKIGLSENEINDLANHENVLKAGVRELPYVIGKKLWASTTVSATMRLAALHSIKAFATGGIGGVHHGKWDVSQDIMELSRTRIIVVSAGPKSILDLAITSEMLETFGVLTVGYKTDQMPAFYSRNSGIKILPVDTVDEIENIFQSMDSLGMRSGLLVFNPIPEEYEIPDIIVKGWVDKAEQDLWKNHISGKQVTPYLLRKLAEYSDGRTIRSNKMLLENNVLLGCEILKAMSKHEE
ncbi:MAG: pseudouridine-5'-phosphate glycosidase [Pelolinea sp.]|nr:pseudouridine-5'-phosphate glycosidase [Pelolinea sp.]